MSLQSGQLDNERLLARRCQEGDSEALAQLRDSSHTGLLKILISRGASQTEAEDLLADLWTDCVPGNDERPSLLDKYSGRCTLRGWLATVATNRFIDLKRQQQRRPQVSPTRDDGESTGFLARIPSPASPDKESGLVDILRNCLQRAFSACGAEGLLMLRLVYLHGLSQRELARMWSCHESTISRVLSQAMEDIQINTLKALKENDAGLELKWEDFVELCQTQELGFL
jgi:RNA polymerase sigma factor (sigma-70 family)